MDDGYWAKMPYTLTVAELAVILRVGSRAVWRQLERGTIPAYRLGGSWIIFRDEARRWIENSNNRTAPRPLPDVLAPFREELTARDLGDLFRKEKHTIYRWLENGVLPARDLGGRWVTTKAEISEALRLAQTYRAPVFEA